LPCGCGCASAAGGGGGGGVALVGPMRRGKSRDWLGVSLCLVIYRGAGGIGSREDTAVLIPFVLFILSICLIRVGGKCDTHKGKHLWLSINKVLTIVNTILTIVRLSSCKQNPKQ